MNIRNGFHTRSDWENTDVTSINRTPPHSRWGAYADADSAAACLPNTSKYIMCLNGQYDFKLYPSPDSVDDFFKPDYDASGFDNIEVPGNWELFGFDKPIYTNWLYPWSYESEEKNMISPGRELNGFNKVPNAPYIPSGNPTGCYLKSFNLPDDFSDRDTFIRFDGVETAFYLWINGHPVGYSEDSKLPAEFNISQYLKKGENLMAIQVMRFADSSYLEDQDYWHISGICRNVWLVSKPKMCIFDYKITAVPDLHKNTGLLTADIKVSRCPGFAKYKVRVCIYDKEKNQLSSGIGGVSTHSDYTVDFNPGANTARVVLNVESIELWYPESPTLYTVVITLISPEGNEVDFESCKTGFRLIEIKDSVVCLNGKRLVIYGVNRHEHHYKTGRFVTKEHLLREIIEMKRMNINSVRTCHYPDSPEWYDLCDEYGLLLICECNIEAHGTLGELTANPVWATNFLERAVRMTANYKNHTSIYSWSLGNESGWGANHSAMAGYVRTYDSTRLCQYEAGNPGADISDIRGNMYATVEQIMAMLCDAKDTRPVILVEYLYQIRNSGGGLEKFVELTEKYERFQGGYVWDWQDKCLVSKDENGNEFWGYGGDFGEAVTDVLSPMYMTCNGIVLPDLTWKPVAFEVKQAYAPVAISTSDKVCDYTVKVNSFVRCLQDYSVIASIRENGLVIHSEELDLGNLAPFEQKQMNIELSYPKNPDCEYHIDFSVRQKSDTFYAEKGYETAMYQFALPGNTLRKTETCEQLSKQINVTETADAYTVKNGTLTTVLSKESGLITALTKGEVNYLQSGAKPNLDRPYSGMEWDGVWNAFDTVRYGNLKLREIETEVFTGISGGKVIIKVSGKLFSAAEGFSQDIPIGRYETSYLFSCSENIDAAFSICMSEGVGCISRAGVELVIPEGFEQLSYFGYGENENYSDRMLSVKLGVYDSTVEQQHFPFIPPSENGGHEGTRWLTLANESGNILRISADKPFHFDVHHNTVEDYQKAAHEHRLIRRKESFLHIDTAHFGIGSNMAWSTVTTKEHRTKAECYDFGFTISVV